MKTAGASIRAIPLAVMLLAGAGCTAAPKVSTGPKVFNNFVTEILNVQGLAREGANAFRIEAPREGWLFFRATSWTERDGAMTLGLASEDAPDQADVLLVGKDGKSTLEAMRYVPKGTHILTADLKRAQLDELTVRIIPVIVYANHPYPPHLPRFGQYDWAWLKKVGMLDSINVIITGLEEGYFMKEWLAQGKQVLQQAGVPGLHIEGPVTEESAYAFWMKKAGLQSHDMSGIIADEFFGSSLKKHPALLPVIKRLRKERPDKVFYPYIAGSGKGLRPFVEPLLDTDCVFAYERYLPEAPTEKEARQLIRDWLKKEMDAFNEYAPGFAGRCIYVMGLFSGPNETLNNNPSANFKTYTDMQFNLLATDSAFAELYGMEMYLAGYCDNEYLRWCAKDAADRSRPLGREMNCHFGNGSRIPPQKRPVSG